MISFILVRPQMGENIGACARAMANFNIKNLDIVNPRDPWPNAAATNNAAGALDILNVNIHTSIPDSIAQTHHTYATTARNRDIRKPVIDLVDAIKDCKSRIEKGQNIAFIFGPERTGLENEDLSYCNTLVTIQTNPDFPSLNLSQAALLIAFNLKQEGILSYESIIKDQNDTPADSTEVQNYLDRLEAALEERGFFQEEKLMPRMKQNVRNMHKRLEPSDHDLRLLHGILSALLKSEK